MKLLSLYIIKEILKGALIASLLLLTLVDLFTLADEMKDIGKGGYTIKHAFQYVALTSPTVFYELMPSSALLGSIFVLGAMSTHRELVAMRVSGLSLRGLLGSILLAGLVLMLLSVIIGELIAPAAQRSAKLLRTNAQENHIVLHSLYGLWLRDGEEFVNVRRVLAEGHLEDINIYQRNDQQQLINIRHVDKALYIGNKRWKLIGVNGTELTNSQQISINNQAEATWVSAINPDLLDIVVVKPDNLSLYDLGLYIDFLQDNNQKSQNFELAFWGRVVNPFATLVMLLVSTPFVLGQQRDGSMGTRMMVGILFGMSFNIFDKIIGHAGIVYNIPPIAVAIFPSLLVFTLAVLAIRRLR